MFEKHLVVFKTEEQKQEFFDKLFKAEDALAALYRSIIVYAPHALPERRWADDCEVPTVCACLYLLYELGIGLEGLSPMCPHTKQHFDRVSQFPAQRS